MFQALDFIPSTMKGKEERKEEGKETVILVGILIAIYWRTI
jgi:hypothetical protein